MWRGESIRTFAFRTCASTSFSSSSSAAGSMFTACLLWASTSGSSPLRCSSDIAPPSESSRRFGAVIYLDGSRSRDLPPDHEKARLQAGPFDIANVALDMARSGLAHVRLDLVLGLGLVLRLLVREMPAMGLDLGLLFLALLVRHCSSFGIFTPLRRCHFSRRAWEDESSH